MYACCRGTINLNYNIQLQGSTAGINNSNTTYFVLLIVVKESQTVGWYQNYLPSGVTYQAGYVGKHIKFCKLRFWIDSSTSEYLCSQPSLFRRQVSGSGSVSYTISPVDGSDLFSTLVLQCRSPTSTTSSQSLRKNDNKSSFASIDWIISPSGVEIDTEMANARPVGSGLSQLPISEAIYPRLYEGEIIVYFLMLFGLLGQMFIAQYFLLLLLRHILISLIPLFISFIGGPRSSREFVMKIHYFFLATIVITLADTIALYYGNSPSRPPSPCRTESDSLLVDYYQFDQLGKRLDSIRVSKGPLPHVPRQFLRKSLSFLFS